MHLLVVGGGSAGHVIPALPVIDAMLDAGDQVSFIGTRSGLEQRLLGKRGVRFCAISAGKLRRYVSWQNFLDLFRVVLGTLQSIWWVGRLHPDVVFSKGGFVSFPVAVASWLWRVPLVAHESDITPGLANRLILPLAKCLCVSFVETEVSAKLEIVHTGTPLRKEILSGDANRGREIVRVPVNRRLLVVTGGSLGADRLNQAVRQALPVLLPDYVVFHVCGANKRVANERAGYQQVEYVGDDWGDILAAADVVISRAGANALFELLALRKLHILIPLPVKASRGDQIDNAAFAERQGYSVVLSEEALTTDTLSTALAEVDARGEEILTRLNEFQVPDSVTRIVDCLRKFGAV